MLISHSSTELANRKDGVVLVKRALNISLTSDGLNELVDWDDSDEWVMAVTNFGLTLFAKSDTKFQSPLYRSQDYTTRKIQWSQLNFNGKPGSWCRRGFVAPASDGVNAGDKKHNLKDELNKEPLDSANNNNKNGNKRLSEKSEKRFSDEMALMQQPPDESDKIKYESPGGNANVLNLGFSPDEAPVHEEEDGAPAAKKAKFEDDNPIPDELPAEDGDAIEEPAADEQPAAAEQVVAEPIANEQPDVNAGEEVEAADGEANEEAEQEAADDDAGEEPAGDAENKVLDADRVDFPET